MGYIIVKLILTFVWDRQRRSAGQIDRRLSFRPTVADGVSGEVVVVGTSERVQRVASWPWTMKPTLVARPRPDVVDAGAVMVSDTRCLTWRQRGGEAQTTSPHVHVGIFVPRCRPLARTFNRTSINRMLLLCYVILFVAQNG